MNEIEILKGILADCDLTNWRKEQGFADVYVRNGFAFATEGHFIVALKSDAAETNTPKFGKAEKLISLAVSGESYDLTELKAFIASQVEPECKQCQGSRRKQCTECAGSGRDECCCDCGETSHEIECITCEGTGRADCDCSYQTLPTAMFGRTIDTRLLGIALKPLPFKTFQISTEGDKESPFALGGEGWRVVIMPTKAQSKIAWEPVKQQQISPVLDIQRGEARIR